MKKLALTSEEISQIVPMIKAVAGPSTRSDQAELKLSFDQSPASNAFAADMLIMYAINRPNHYEYVSNEVASATGLDAESLHRTAVKNFPSHLGEVQLHDCGDGLYGLSAGGDFEASLLLLDDLWLQLETHLPGEPLAAAPSRDLLFVIGSDRPNSLALISEKARIELPDKRYAISQSVLVRRAGKWVAHTN